MNKHTAGPWLSRGKSDSVHESSNTHPYGCQIFRFAEDQGPSDDDLNLILSAPDLLEALEKLLADFESAIHNEYDGTHVLNGILAEVDYARAAIARARGEA